MQVFWILVLLLQYQEEIPMSVKVPTEVFVAHGHNLCIFEENTTALHNNFVNHAILYNKKGLNSSPWDSTPTPL